jgi:uncharacterized cysteine cluster protein YcgN (CxxCxxCC family)
MKERFWREKTLAQMTAREWESLCDGCGRCCLHKIEDEDTGEILFTRVACKLLDLPSCRCTQYRQRTHRVADCLDLRAGKHRSEWLPSTCAYRLLAEGSDLPAWHPLLTGRADSVHEAGISARHFALTETPDIHPEDHVIEEFE